MADKVKEVNQTPPSSQPTTDDNRRRTRSQTRNGGVTTTPTPVPESRGRKRATQSQPSSGNKRGRKSAASSNSGAKEEPESSLSSANTETEVHSNQAENKDLSKQKPSESNVVSEAPQTDTKKDTVDKGSKDTVKSRAKDDEKNNSKQEAQKKPSGKEENPTDACKLKKPEPQPATKIDDSVESADEKDQKVQDDEKKEDPTAAAQGANEELESSLSSTITETEVQPNQVGNQDLSKQKPSESAAVGGSPQTDAKKDTVDKESNDTVKSQAKDGEKNNSKQEAQQKAPEKDKSLQDACTLKKPDPQQVTKIDDSVTSADKKDQKVQDDEKKEDPTAAAQGAKTTGICSLPKKGELKVAGETNDGLVLKVKPDVVVGEETQD